MVTQHGLMVPCWHFLSYRVGLLSNKGISLPLPMLWLQSPLAAPRKFYSPLRLRLGLKSSKMPLKPQGCIEYPPQDSISPYPPGHPGFGPIEWLFLWA